MRGKVHSSAKRDIQNIILVLVLAVASAVGLCLYMITAYGPTGRYLVSSTLLDPAVAQQIDYYDPTVGKRGMAARFVLSGYEFSYFDPAKKSMKKVQVDQKDYEELYALISADKSLEEVPQAMVAAFNRPDVAVLRIMIRSGTQEKVFQEVQFAPSGDLFRILLHQENTAIQWVYFSHPAIFETVMKWGK